MPACVRASSAPRGAPAQVAVALMASTAFAVACGGSPHPGPEDPVGGAGATVLTRFQMGTLVRIAVGETDTPEVRSAIEGAFDAIDAVVAVMSEWESETDISRVNEGAGGTPIPVAAPLITVLDAAHTVSEASDGAFDVTWAPFRDVWCFDPGCEVPDPADIEAARDLVDYRRVEIDRDAGTVRLPDSSMSIGLGGVAKGYAIHRAVNALREAGLADFVVDAGGDVYAAGADGDTPWRVAVAHPRGGPPLGVVDLRDQAMVTSGDYEHYIEVDGARHHHIIDVRTGWPARGLMQATVVTDDPTVADALATAAFVLGPVDGLAMLESWPGAEGLLVTEDLAVLVTSGW